MHLLAYPNPNTGTFRLSFKGTGEAITLNITDLSGKIVETRAINASSEVVILDYSDSKLSAGMYLINLIGQTSFASTPLVITK
jgi:hypothetical protein